MAQLTSLHRRFLASTGGVAAIEFGLVFPMLLVLLLASIDAGRAVAISMKVRASAYAMDAMANQYLSIQDSDMQQILGAAAAVIAPYSSSPVVLTLSQIEVNSNGQATVVWSDTLNGTARPKGAITVPSTLTATTNPNKICASYTNGCFFLLAEVQYTYTPMFGHFITGPINLADKVYIAPRSVACIPRPNSCTP